MDIKTIATTAIIINKFERELNVINILRLIELSMATYINMLSMNRYKNNNVKQKLYCDTLCGNFIINGIFYR